MDKHKNANQVRLILGNYAACNQQLSFSSRLRYIFSPCPVSKTKKSWRLPRKLLGFSFNIFIGAAVLVLVFYFVPALAFKYLPLFNSGGAFGEQLWAWTSGSTAGIEKRQAEMFFEPGFAPLPSGKRVDPDYDLTAPAGRWFIAPTASIEAEIYTTPDMNDKNAIDKLMSTGAYLYPDYAEFGQVGRTVILVAHHYNMFMSKKDSRRIFQNLNRVALGDHLQIIDDYKIWNYQVYKVEKAEAVSETDADLIAYTCVYWWDSKLRLFVYAKLIET
jgi:hypothetical protein